MSDKMVCSLDLLTDAEKADLTEEQKECFKLNDEIFRIHEDFKNRVTAAKNAADLESLLDEHAGKVPGLIGGTFGEIIKRLEAIENSIAFFVLAEAFEQKQQEAARLFHARYTELVGPPPPATPKPKKEWN